MTVTTPQEAETETGPSRGRFSHHVDPGHHPKESTGPEPHSGSFHQR